MNILLGVLFTSIVLLIFLHDLRATFIVAMSMPTSIISTFMLFGMFDMSLNMMSLMGISVSVGVLVANSVVVIENIFRHKAMGKKKKKAAYEGTSEVTVAVFAATLTNLVVFIPIANMSSMVGMFLAELALAASFATIFSLVMSFTLTPMLASLILPKEIKPNRIGRMMDNFDAWYSNIYRKMLDFVLKYKSLSLATIVFAFALSVGFFWAVGDKIGSEFMPLQDQGEIDLKAELPEGTNLDETAKLMAEIEDIIKKHPEVEHILTTLGKQDDGNIGTNLATMTIKLVDVKYREIGITDMVSTMIKDVSAVPNAKIKIQAQESMGKGGGDPIQFFVMGQDNDKLEHYKDIVNKEIRGIKGLINLDNSSRSGKPEISIYPNRKMLSDAGLTVMDVAYTVRASIEGIVSSQYRQSGNEYDILVTLDDESVNSPEKIGNIPVVSRAGTFRLSQLADVKFTKGYSKILHRDKFTSIMFSAGNSAEEKVGTVTNEITKKLDNINFEPGYGYKWGGMTKMMNEAMADFIFAFMLAILLTYMLLAAILESFVQPIFILLTIPLAMSGVLLSLYWFDIALGITSQMAIVMLIGIVVNNAILMLDYTNILYREKGYSAREALVEACGTKLKPILMSSIAITLGMLPMALGIGDAGREMRIPLGVVSIGGLISSTILGLFVIPSFYLLWVKISDLIKGIFTKHDDVEDMI
jgi:HAE1 family hydrophobic/amphiphilic exporter-1